MKLRLERTALKKNYTIGHLYAVDEKGGKTYICDTIEDKVRDLNKNGVFDNGEKKVAKLTAIPYGTYQVSLYIKSPKFSNFTKYPYAKKYDGYLPRLLNVNHFEGILIHCGRTEKSSAGCIIVGYNKVVGQVINSEAAFYKLMDTYLVPAKKKGEKITIEIV